MRCFLVMSVLGLASPAVATPFCHNSPGATVCTQDDQCGQGSACHFDPECVPGQSSDCDKRGDCTYPESGACAVTCDVAGGGGACPQGTTCSRVGAVGEYCLPSGGGGTGGTTGGGTTTGGTTGGTGGTTCPTAADAGCNLDDQFGFCENKGCYLPAACGGRIGPCVDYCGDSCDPNMGCTKECPSGFTCTKNAETRDDNVCLATTSGGTGTTGGGGTGTAGGSGTGTTGSAGGGTGSSGSTGSSGTTGTPDAGTLKCSASHTGSPAGLLLVLLLCGLVAGVRRCRVA